MSEHDEHDGREGGPTLLRDLDEHGVLTLSLHRPHRRNAWNVEMENAYFGALDEAADDPAVRVVVLTGSGDDFCTGIDAARLDDVSSGTVVDLSERRSVADLRRFPKPLVAAVNGACAGIGLVHALLCDVRFVADEARLATAFTRRGLAGERAITWLLPRIVGLENALDLLLSGRTVGAAEAARLGLASRTAPRSEVLAAAQSYAREIAQRCSPVALAVMREQVYDDLDRSFDESVVTSDRVMIRMSAGPAVTEAVAAHREGRLPTFRPLPPQFDARTILEP